MSAWAKIAACLLALCLAQPAVAQQMYAGPSNGLQPADSIGPDNAWYIDTSNYRIWGPKLYGTWANTGPILPPGSSLVGGTTPITGTCTNGQFLYNNSGILGCSTSSATIAFPQAVTGGVSGGIGYFSSTSTFSASALLTANALMIGGGSGQPPTTTSTGTNVLTALASTPTGSGSLVLATSPSLTTPNLGTPSAINLANGSALPVSGLSGLGTGVGTALGNATNGASGLTTQAGAITTGNCLKWGPGVQDSGGTCGGGAGSISFPQTVAGTTTSGGLVYFSGATTISSSALLTANALVVGGGAGTAPAALGSVGTTTTVLHGNASGAPTYGAVNLATDVTGNAPVPINAQTGTTYTIASTDNGKLVTTSNAGAIAVTLPQATGSFTTGFVFGITNIGAGTATITPTTSTINGASTLVLTTKQGLTVISDGTNWQIANPGIAAASSGLTVGTTTITSGTNGRLEYNNSGVLGELPVGTNVTAALANTLSSASGLTSTIASGATAMGTGAITSATCATVVTATATNVATTDVVTASFNGDPTAVTGYVPLTTGMLTIIAYPTSGNVNFKVCNNTSASITPGAITLNWRVVR